MNSSPRKPRRRNPAVTREVILEAARKILASDGPEALSILSVTHAAGVNRGTIYLPFENREAVIEAAIESVSEALLQSGYGDQAALAASNVADIDHAALA